MIVSSSKSKSLKNDIDRFIRVDNCILADERGSASAEMSLPSAFIRNLSEMSLQEISYVIADRFFNGDLPSEEIKRAVSTSINFPMPLVFSDDMRHATLDLTKGPSGSSKDFIVGFLVSVLKCELNRGLATPVNIIIATDNDMFCSIAEAVKGMKDINVYVLCPYGKFKDAATVPDNVHKICVSGGIEECRELLCKLRDDADAIGLYDLIIVQPGSAIIRMASAIPYFWSYAQLSNKLDNISQRQIVFKEDFYGGLEMAIRMGLSRIFLAFNDGIGIDFPTDHIASDDDTSSKNRIYVDFIENDSADRKRSTTLNHSVPISPTLSALKKTLRALYERNND